MNSTAKPATILFAHGSRDPKWAQPFVEIQRAVKARQPGTEVELAFLEFMEPTLEKLVAELVTAGCRIITIAPLFMAQGAHLKNDLAGIMDAIRAGYPATEFKQLPAIGEVGAILDAISDWVVFSTQR